MKGKYIDLNKNKRDRNVVIGCLAVAAVLVIVSVGNDIVTGVSGKKVDTSEGMAIIRQAEKADVTAIETKIQKLRKRNLPEKKSAV